MPSYTKEEFDSGLPLKILKIVTKLMNKRPDRLMGEKIEEFLESEGSTLDEMAELRVRDVYSLITAQWICQHYKLPTLENASAENKAMSDTSFCVIYNELVSAFNGIDLTSNPATGRVLDQFLQSDVLSKLVNTVDAKLAENIYRWLDKLENVLLHLQNIELHRFQDPRMRRDLLHAYQLFARVAKLVTPKTSVYDLQNLLVEEGKKVYEMGAFSSSAQMLGLKRHELVAWHMAQSVIESLGKKVENLLPKDQKKFSEIYISLCHLEKGREQPDVDGEKYEEKIDALCKEIAERLREVIYVKQGVLDNAISLLKENLSVFDRYAPSLGKIYDEKKLRGLVIGDSWSISLNAESEPWVTQLLRTLRGDGYPVDIANVSFAGSQTMHGVQLLPSQLHIWRPNFLLITLGGNDAFQRVDIWQTAFNIIRMIKICREFDPSIQILVSFGIPETFEPASDCHRHSVEHFIHALDGEKFKEFLENTDSENFAVQFLKPYQELLTQNPPVKAEPLELSLLRRDNIGPDQIHAKDVTGLFKQCDRILRPILDQMMDGKGLKKSFDLGGDDASNGKGNNGDLVGEAFKNLILSKGLTKRGSSELGTDNNKDGASAKGSQDPVYQALTELVISRGFCEASVARADDEPEDLQTLVEESEHLGQEEKPTFTGP